MEKQIKILCADLLHGKQLRDGAKKKTNGNLDSVIAMTARAALPDSKEIEELQLSLIKEKQSIDSLTKKAADLHDLAVKRGMSQMAMNLTEE